MTTPYGEAPHVGEMVLYTLSAFDAQEINRRRHDFQASRAGHEQTGYTGHVGNEAHEGDECPALVVRTFGGPAANLKVFLDGNDVLWATSRVRYTGDAGGQPGCWVRMPDARV